MSFGTCICLASETPLRLGNCLVILLLTVLVVIT